MNEPYRPLDVLTNRNKIFFFSVISHNREKIVVYKAIIHACTRFYIYLRLSYWRVEFFRIVVYDWQVNVAKDGTEMTEFRECSDTETSTLSESKFQLCITP